MAKSYDDKIVEKIELQRKKEKSYLYLAARVYAIFVFSIYPLYFGTEGYNDMINQKAHLYWGVTIAFFVAFVLFLIVYKFGSGKGEFETPFWKRIKLPDYAAAAFLLIITLSCIFSEYRDEVLKGVVGRNDGWLTYACALAGFFIISRWYKPRQLDFIIFGISSALVCIYGFLQFNRFDFLKLFPYTQSNMLDANGLPRFSGLTISFRTTIGNINFVGIYVAICVVFFGILYLKTKGKLRFFYCAVSVLNFALRIIAHSDSAIVGILGTAVILIPYWIAEKGVLGRLFVLSSLYGFAYVIHHNYVINIILPGINEGSPSADYNLKNGYSTLPLTPIIILSVLSLIIGILLLYVKIPWVKVKTAQITGLAILLAMIVVGVAGIEVIGKKYPNITLVYEAREMMHGNFGDRFGSGRMFVWKRAIMRVPELPVLGTGSDTFKQAFGDANNQESGEVLGVIFDKAHNDFIQIMLCNGVPALAAYLLLILSILAVSIKRAFQDEYLLAALGAVIAYLGQSFFGIDTVTVTPLFWLMLAVAWGRHLTPETYENAQ